MAEEELEPNCRAGTKGFRKRLARLHHSAASLDVGFGSSRVPTLSPAGTSHPLLRPPEPPPCWQRSPVGSSGAESSQQNRQGACVFHPPPPTAWGWGGNQPPCDVAARTAVSHRRLSLSVPCCVSQGQQAAGSGAERKPVPKGLQGTAGLVPWGHPHSWVGKRAQEAQRTSQG